MFQIFLNCFYKPVPQNPFRVLEFTNPQIKKVVSFPCRVQPTKITVGVHKCLIQNNIRSTEGKSCSAQV